MAALQPGRLLARRYRLIDQVGAGGMSVIWRARDEVLDRVVAVKVLAPSLAADARFRDMVREEARSAAQLVHPHVTAVHDYGETLAPDGEITSFVVMELLSGEELENRLSEGPLPWPEAVEVGAQVAEALAAAHRLGIVHRDITPANVMMTRTGAKVLDFGIATQVGAPDEDEDGGTFGTPAYVAPERLDGAPAQPATDVYSLGVLLYETLTGRVPFPADTWEDLGAALQSDERPSLDGVPGLPPAVARTCLRCLARDPRDRPTAHQLAAALRDQMLPGDPQAATMLSPTVTLPALPAALGTGDDPEADGASAAAPHRDQSKTTPGHHRRAARPAGRRPLVVVGGLVLVITTAALIAPTLTPRSPAPPSNALPTTAPATDPPITPDDEITVPPAAPTAAATSTSPPSRPQPTPDGGQGAGGLTEAAERLRTLIDDGVRSGDIRPDVGLDLRNVLANLTREAADGRTDLAEPVARLREKVTRRVQEGAITPAFARQLDTAIVDLGAGQV